MGIAFAAMRLKEDAIFVIGLFALISIGAISGIRVPPDRQVEVTQTSPVSSASPRIADVSLEEAEKVRGEERSRVRATILKHIDKNPNKAEKEKLYYFVLRGKDLERLLAVVFDTAVGRLSRQELESIKARFQQADVQELLKDTGLALIVLGFADRIGADDMGYDVSRLRAESVASVLRNECGIRQVIYIVPTGSRISPDPHDYAKSRTAEVWWVRP